MKFDIEWTHDPVELTEEQQKILDEELKFLEENLQSAGDLLCHIIFLERDACGATIAADGIDNTIYLTYYKMNINHRPIFDVEMVCKLYSEKDGVDVKYVCTSALSNEAQAMDIFYRETPHPDFGNRYFGLYRNADAVDVVGTVMITNADKIEDAEFGMVQAGGQLHYSQHRHDFYSVGQVSIDGGRAYFRRVGDMSVPAKWFKIKDGEFVEIE